MKAALAWLWQHGKDKLTQRQSHFGRIETFDETDQLASQCLYRFSIGGRVSNDCAKRGLAVCRWICALSHPYPALLPMYAQRAFHRDDRKHGRSEA